MANKMKIDVVAFWLLVIGAINWGLTGLFDYNLVAVILGGGLFAKIVYGAIGVSGVYKLLQMFKIVK